MNRDSEVAENYTKPIILLKCKTVAIQCFSFYTRNNGKIIKKRLRGLHWNRRKGCCQNCGLIIGWRSIQLITITSINVTFHSGMLRDALGPGFGGPRSLRVPKFRPGRRLHDLTRELLIRNFALCFHMFSCLGTQQKCSSQFNWLQNLNKLCDVDKTESVRYICRD